MSEHPTASEWAAARGEKWSANLDAMEAMLSPVDAPLIAALQLDGAYRIADIGCGGGGTAFEVLRRAPLRSIVDGFDVSPAQIESARRRLAPEQRSLAFHVADVAAAVPEEPYHRLVSRFGVMFFGDPPRAFANLVRWLVPGGRFAFAVWGAPADNPWLTTVREVVSEVVDLPAIDLESPGPFRYSNAERLLNLLGHAGFGNLEVRDWRGTLRMGGGLTAAGAAQFALSAFSSFADLLTKAGDEAFNTARQSLTARFSRHQQNNIVQLDAWAHLVIGARPND